VSVQTVKILTLYAEGEIKMEAVKTLKSFLEEDIMNDDGVIIKGMERLLSWILKTFFVLSFPVFLICLL
jgi:hypothetical protein